MPFRSNMFQTQYAQPGTEMGEIDDLMLSKYGDVPSTFGAVIDDDGGDTQFKFGGRIQFNPLADGEEDIEDLGFDGFDSIEDARRWLIDEIGIKEGDIEVEG